MRVPKSLSAGIPERKPLSADLPCCRRIYASKSLSAEISADGSSRYQFHCLPSCFRKDCDVLELDFQDSELHGTLSPAFMELPSLQKLILTGTSVSGHLAVLANSSELVELQLQDLDVAGDLRELERATKIETLNLLAPRPWAT